MCYFLSFASIIEKKQAKLKTVLTQLVWAMPLFNHVTVFFSPPIVLIFVLISFRKVFSFCVAVVGTFAAYFRLAS